MARLVALDVLLPLTAGGWLRVARPLGLDEVVAEAEVGLDEAIATRLLEARRTALRPLVASVPDLPADATSFRLAAGIANLVLMSHPRWDGAGAEAARRRLGQQTEALLRLPAPITAAEILRRHSVVARLGQVRRTDHDVRLWWGRRHFVGRPPPARVVALPRLRGVRVESTSRAWWREVGVPAEGQAALTALLDACPLLDALEVGRLEPPVAWPRLLSVFRHATLARAVAARLVGTGGRVAGAALVAALARHAAGQVPGGRPASADDVRLALAFVAHVAWLGEVVPWPRAGSEEGPRGDGPDDFVGPEVASLLTAALDVDRRLVVPPDVGADSDLDRALWARAAIWRTRAEDAAADGRALASELARIGASALASPDRAGPSGSAMMAPRA